MKLQRRISSAFLISLIATMLFAAVVIRSLVLDVLIENEKSQLSDKAELLGIHLYDDFIYHTNTDYLLEDVRLFVYDLYTDHVPLRSSELSIDTVNRWVKAYDLSAEDQPLWRDGDTKYVVSILPIYPRNLNPVKEAEQVLVLVTPLNLLESIQTDLFTRLIIIFLFGTIVIGVLTHFLTKRLVTPIEALKQQLKKVEKREFEAVKRIKATGEIKELEESFIDMAKSLERYMKSQQQFFQNASHELKTPLMTIQGYAEGIKDGIFTEGEQTAGLEIISQEIYRLKKIINEMILLAKLDSDEEIYKKEPIYMSNMIKQVLERALPYATDQGVCLLNHLKADAVVIVDQEKLLRALMNIMINAIRHAEATVQILVYQEQGQLCIHIDDDGPGINEQLLPHLFDRFIKGKDGETGLGLAISKAIINRCDGTITVTKAPLGGARFTITL